MTAKVRIKAGPVEFEYEGETELSITDIKDLFTHIETLFTVPSLSTPTGEAADDNAAGATVGDGAPGAKATKLHVNSIAAKIGAKSGPEVAVAAAAHLQITEGKASFSRSDLLRTMKAANHHYKVSMSKNLSTHIASLVGKQFNQQAQDRYSLTAEALKKLEAQLAE